jgi:hypothetical protein
MLRCRYLPKPEPSRNPPTPVIARRTKVALPATIVLLRRRCHRRKMLGTGSILTSHRAMKRIVITILLLAAALCAFA